MLIEIKKINGKLIYSGDHKNLKNAVEYCVKNEISLNGAYLDGAFLDGALYSILSILKINFNSLSNLLTLELMRWDCISCGEEKMDIWKNGGACPFNNSVREFYFKEKRELWISGKPTMNYKELFIALCKEKKIKI